jgi:hypothetical protein
MFVTRVMTLGGVAAIYAASLAIAHSALFARAPGTLGLAITIDLTLTAGALVYFAAVRRGAAAPWLVFATVGTGLMASHVLLPGGGGKAALAYAGVAEIGLLVALARRPRALGRLGALLLTEVAILRDAFTGWFRKPAPGDFAVHRNWPAMATALVVLTAGETPLVHILLARASVPAAWVATALSIYAILWIVGDAQALRLSRVRVADGAIDIRIGLRWQIAVPRDLVAAATRIDARPENALRAFLLWPNVLLTLRAPVVARGPFGIERQVTRIALGVDEPEAFLAAVA